MVAEASASNADEIACRVFLLGDGTPNGGLLVFEAQVQLAASYPPAPAAQRLVNGLQLPQIHQPGQLYAHGMFHGPRLQGCTRIDGHSSEGLVAELTTLPTPDYFAEIRIGPGGERVGQYL